MLRIAILVILCVGWAGATDEIRPCPLAELAKLRFGSQSGMVLLVPPSVGRHYDVHGISKGNDPLNQLRTLLDSGIQPGGFHSGPLVPGSPITPFTVGANFVVISRPGKPITEGFGTVVVSDTYREAIPHLQAIYGARGINFLTDDEAPAFLGHAARAAGLSTDTLPPLSSPFHPSANSPAATEPARAAAPNDLPSAPDPRNMQIVP